MSSNSIKIIDPHIHLWDPKNTPKSVSPLVKKFGWSPWLLDKLARIMMPKPIIDFVGRSDYVLKAHLPETFHQDCGKYKIDGYVHIQAGWESKNPVGTAGETTWLETLSDKPIAIVGQANLSDSTNLNLLLDAHASLSPRFKGVRDMVASHPENSIFDWHANKDAMNRDEFRRGYKRLGDRNLTFDAFVYSNQLEDFAQLTSDIPETKVVLDHIGTPIALGGTFANIGATEKERETIKNDWYEGLAKVAENDHVHLKLSGMFMPIVGFDLHNKKTNTSLTQIVDKIGPHIEYAIDTFGIDRCMFASNFPMDKVSLSYEMLYDAYFQIVDNHSNADKKKLFRNNALNFYNVKN